MSQENSDSKPSIDLYIAVLLVLIPLALQYAGLTVNVYVSGGMFLLAILVMSHYIWQRDLSIRKKIFECALMLLITLPLVVLALKNGSKKQAAASQSDIQPQPNAALDPNIKISFDISDNPSTNHNNPKGPLEPSDICKLVISNVGPISVFDIRTQKIERFIDSNGKVTGIGNYPKGWEKLPILKPYDNLVRDLTEDTVNIFRGPFYKDFHTQGTITIVVKYFREPDRKEFVVSKTMFLFRDSQDGEVSCEDVDAQVGHMYDEFKALGKQFNKEGEDLPF